MGPFTSCFALVDFGEIELGFHGHVGPCRICCLSTDIFVVVYVYMYMCLIMQLTLLSQVAVVWFCVCVLFSVLVSCVGFGCK